MLATIVLTVACGDRGLVTEPTPPPDVDPWVPTLLWLEGTLTLNGDPYVGVSVTLNEIGGELCGFSTDPSCVSLYNIIRTATITDNNGSWTLRYQVNCGRSSEGSLGALFYSVEGNVRTTHIAVVNRCTEDVQVFDHDIQDSP